MAEALQVNSPESWWPGSSRPFLIAGPCGVESPEQINTVAKDLAVSGVSVLRGGIWKPRTRPGSFQGIGAEGLAWLKSAGLQNGMKVITEVADSEHVEQSLAAGIDMVWLGARTVVNPFQVQRIVDALQGVDIPVLVKNPLTPDLELWIGALERLNNAGITKLMAVHRGFTAYERSRYRNAPNWPIPIELKRRFPELPVLCDPSHIAGVREMIGPVAQTALDLNYDGLMIEVHPDPDKALSDRGQQLVPDDFRKLIQGLLVRNKSFDSVIAAASLEELRSRIDVLDHEVLQLLFKRMLLSREIGALKKEHNVSIYQLERWNDILQSRPSEANGVDPLLTRDFIIKLFELIHEESIHQQTQVMHKQDLPVIK
jgi:chorismate mutase